LRGDYIGAALRTLIEWKHFLRSPFKGTAFARANSIKTIRTPIAT
jgi:hypothetical protein